MTQTEFEQARATAEAYRYFCEAVNALLAETAKALDTEAEYYGKGTTQGELWEAAAHAGRFASDAIGTAADAAGFAMWCVSDCCRALSRAAAADGIDIY